MSLVRIVSFVLSLTFIEGIMMYFYKWLRSAPSQFQSMYAGYKSSWRFMAAKLSFAVYLMRDFITQVESLMLDMDLCDPRKGLLRFPPWLLSMRKKAGR